MIRLIARSADRGAAANVGGPVDTEYKTFDVDLPEVEAWLLKNSGKYLWSEIVGAEIIKKEGA